MKLEAQLAELAAAGLALAPGVTVDDLVDSCLREEYEAEPFDLILYMLGLEVGREPWGRPFCLRAWNFDTECIAGEGSYVKLVERLARVAGAEARVSGVKDRVAAGGDGAWVEYAIDGKPRRWKVEIHGDWADMTVVSHVLADLERDGRRFYGRDNGQATVLFYLEEASAARINELSHGLLEPMVR